MSSAAKLRHFGKGTAAVATAAMVMTAFGPAAFASWDRDATGAYQVTPTSGWNGTIGILDDRTGTVPGDQDPGDSTFAAGTLTAGGGLNIDPAGTENADENEGANLIYPGRNDQRIADVRLVLPNRFVSGENLDLRLLDRSATETDDGLSNKDAGTLLGFSSTEGVTVEVSGPMSAATRVHEDTDFEDVSTTPTAGNTETKMVPWATDSAAAATSLRNTKPTTAPKFVTSISQSNNVQGNDNLRLSVRDVKADGDPNAVWVVTISGLKVNLGANVTPGELRLVPFLSNTAEVGTDYYDSPWFYGNRKGRTSPTVLEREIGIYTVPAYVSPVAITSQNNIVADDSPQAAGDITLTETAMFSLANGTYDLNISGSAGAVITNTDPKTITVKVENGGTSETVTATVENNGGTLRLNLTGADMSKVSKITVSGVLLQAAREGTILFNLSGASISGGADSWLPSPAGSSTLTRSSTDTKSKPIYPDSAFLNFDTAAGVGGTDTESRTITTPATISGETLTPATAVAAPTMGTQLTGTFASALPAGTYSVATASGTTTITGPTGSNITLTSTTPRPGPMTFTGTYNNAPTPDTYVFTIPADITSFDLGVPATYPASAASDPDRLVYGAHVYADLDTTGGATPVTEGDTLTVTNGVGTFVLTRTGTANEWSNGGNTYTIADADALAGFTIGTNPVTAHTPTTTGVTVATGTSPTPGTTTDLIDGDYTVSADLATISGAGLVLTRIGSTNEYRVSSKSVAATDPAVGDTFTFTGATANAVIRIAAGVVTGTVAPSSVTVPSGAGGLAPGTYTVAADAGTPATNDFTIEGPAGPIGPVVNGQPVTDDWDNVAGTPDTAVTFQGLAVGQSFTVTASLAVTIADWGVNQRDIMAPLDQLQQAGIAQAESARIGGNNRYSTAAKIAAAWTSGVQAGNPNDPFGGGKAANAIIVSGRSYADALSASYLSQRAEAPILLAGPNGLPAETIEALRDRLVEKVFIVGGSAAVSDAIEAQLKDLNQYVGEYNQGTWRNPKPSGAKLQVERLGGQSRYTTNQLVNMYAAAWGGTRTIGKTQTVFGQALRYTAIVARGDNFPDALAGGVLTAGRNHLAGVNSLPMILTEPTALSESAKEQYTNLDIEHAILIGSTDALSSAVQSATDAMKVTTARLGGKDRYATAGEVAKFALKSSVGSDKNTNPGLGYSDDDLTVTPPLDQGTTEFVYLATGLNFPDALAAAPFIGYFGDVLGLVQTNALTDSTEAWLKETANTLDRAIGLGMGNVVGADVIKKANEIVSGQ